MSGNRNQYDGSSDKKQSRYNPLKHLGMMSICCLLPILIISILPLLNINNTGANTVITGISSLICPIVMGIMMFTMLRGNKSHSCCKEEDRQRQ